MDAISEPARLDDVDRNIIAELTRDGRKTVTQVAENLHISRHTPTHALRGMQKRSSLQSSRPSLIHDQCGS